MEDEPEVIRQSMQDNRTALTEKLEALEERVMGVATAVSDTVENVKEGVSDTVESVKETVAETVTTVRDAFDLRKQVEAHPLAMVGGSFGVGFLIGILMPNRTPAPATSAAAAASTWQPPPDKPASSSLFSGASGLLDTFTEGLGRLKNAALGSIVGLVKETVTKAVPAEMGEQIKTIFDDMASKLQGSGSSETGSDQHSSGGQSREKGHESSVGNESKVGRSMGSTAW